VNPVVKITLKYPQWYDSYQDNGYDVMQQTAVFSAIFAGTEARNYADQKWGGFPAYTSFFVMRWLTDVAAASRHKVNGGWYDASGTSPASYLEQARQTILGGARDTLKNTYGGLQSGVPADDVAALRQHQAELSSVAAEVAQRDLVGISAYKPPNSHGGCRSYFGHECARGEVLVYSFVGMLGFPLLPTSTFPNQARSAFFSVHALHDKNFTIQLVALLHTGATVLLTDGLADAINTTEAMHALLRRPTVRVLHVNGDPARLLSHPPPELPALRAALLGPLGVCEPLPALSLSLSHNPYIVLTDRPGDNLSFLNPDSNAATRIKEMAVVGRWPQVSLEALPLVGFYPFRDGSFVVENFRNTSVDVRVGAEKVSVEARGWHYHWMEMAGLTAKGMHPERAV